MGRNVLKIVFIEVRGQRTNIQTVEVETKKTQRTVFAINAFDFSHT